MRGIIALSAVTAPCSPSIPLARGRPSPSMLSRYAVTSPIRGLPGIGRGRPTTPARILRCLGIILYWLPEQECSPAFPRSMMILYSHAKASTTSPKPPSHGKDLARLLMEDMSCPRSFTPHLHHSTASKPIKYAVYVL